MKRQSFTVSPVLAGFTYVGAVIGAGFASGQEVLQFFTLLGPKGGLGIVVSAILFTLFGHVIFRTARDRASSSYRSLVDRLCSSLVAALVDLAITAYLFSSLVAMAAGAGAVCSQLGVGSHHLGSLVLLVMTAATVAWGLSAVVTSIGAVAPVMTVSVVSIAVMSLLVSEDCLNSVNVFAAPSVNNWIVSTSLYVSYNMLGAVSVLVPLGRCMRGPRQPLIAAIIGGLGLGVGALASHLAMASEAGCRRAEVPMMALAFGIAPWIGKAFGAIIVAEVFTTAVASLYGLTGRVLELGADEGVTSRLAVVGIICGLAWVMSSLGLEKVVKVVYPAMGFVGILLCFLLLREWFRWITKGICLRIWKNNR